MCAFVLCDMRRSHQRVVLLLTFSQPPILISPKVLSKRSILEISNSPALFNSDLSSLPSYNLSRVSLCAGDMTQVTNVGEDEKWQAIRGAKRFSSGQQWFEVVISRQANTANTVRARFPAPFHSSFSIRHTHAIFRYSTHAIVRFACSKVLYTRHCFALCILKSIPHSLFPQLDWRVH